MNYLDPDGANPRAAYWPPFWESAPGFPALEPTPGGSSSGRGGQNRQSGVAGGAGIALNWWRKYMAALSRAQEEFRDPECVEFLERILAWARSRGIGNTLNLTVDSLSRALLLAVKTTQFGSKSHPEMASDPSIRAAVEGPVLYLGDPFFAAGSSVIANMQTLIHEAFHLAISPDRPSRSSSHNPSYILYGAALTDEEIAQAAGVYENHWDQLAPRERRLRASGAFSAEMGRHCR